MIGNLGQPRDLRCAIRVPHPCRATTSASESPIRSELSEVNKACEFLFKHFRNLRFRRIRANRHSHGDRASPQGAGRYTDISTAPLTVGHFAYIVDSNSRWMQQNFDREDLAMLCDAMAHVVDALNGVGEHRGPLGNIAGLRKNVVKLARFQIRFERSRYCLSAHKYLDVQMSREMPSPGHWSRVGSYRKSPSCENLLIRRLAGSMRTHYLMFRGRSPSQKAETNRAVIAPSAPAIAVGMTAASGTSNIWVGGTATPARMHRSVMP